MEEKRGKLLQDKRKATPFKRSRLKFGEENV
jgi:hypothetical protein